MFPKAGQAWRLTRCLLETLEGQTWPGPTLSCTSQCSARWRRASVLLRVRSLHGWLSFPTGLAESHRGCSSAFPPPLAVSWDCISISSRVAPTLLNGEEAQAISHSSMPPARCRCKRGTHSPIWWWEASAGGASSSYIQIKCLAVFLVLSIQALGRQKAEASSWHGE